MAVLDLSVTISDDDFPRLMAAAKAAWVETLGQSPSDAQVIEALRVYGIEMMRQLVRNYEKAIAVAQAEALEPTIEVS